MTVHDEHVGKIEIRITDDGMTATLSIPAGLDSDAISFEMLTRRVEEAGIAGSDAHNDTLRAVCEEYARNPASVEIVIATGTPVENGIDGRLEWLPEFDPTATEAEGPQRACEDPANVNFYDGQVFVRVRAGTHVATLHQATEGLNGRTVQGKVIKATPGRPCKIRFESSLQAEPDGRVIAQNDGVLMIVRECASVAQVFSVPGSVDFSSGNIDFDGTVTVREGVRDRFVVKATGDIVINGLVESAQLMCGGTLTCRRGMAGKDRGQILVGADAEFGFINNVRGQINGSLTVRREIVNCDLIVGGDCICDQASVIGGRLCVSGNGRIGVLGSEAERPTEVRLGAVPLLSLQHKRVESAIAPLSEEAASLKMQLDAVTVMRGSRKTREQGAVTQLRLNLERVLQQVEELKARKTELEDRIRRTRMVDFQVSRLIYPKVTLRVGDIAYCFETALKGPITLGWDERRELRYRLASGWTRPLSEIARQINRAA